MRTRELAELLMAVMQAMGEAADCGDEEVDDLNGALGTDVNGDTFEGIKLVSYEQGGYLTGDAGFVAEFEDATFQVTVKRSR